MSMIVLPPISGQGLSQIAVDLELITLGRDSSEGVIELYARSLEGSLREIDAIAVKAGVQLVGTAFEEHDVGVEARWVVHGNVTATAYRSLIASKGNANGLTEDWFTLNPGASPASGTVTALLLWDDGSGPSLIVGGAFAGGIARWDGVAWSSLGAAPGSGLVSCIAIAVSFAHGPSSEN